MSADHLVIDLPRPPSVNRIWRSRKGRAKPYLDQGYATWKREADNLCLANGWHKKPIIGRFTAVITVDRKRCGGNSDIDNRIKAALDWLQQAGIIENDNLANSITARWGRAPAGCRITLKAVEPAKVAA